MTYLILVVSLAMIWWLCAHIFASPVAFRAERVKGSWRIKCKLRFPYGWRWHAWGDPYGGVDVPWEYATREDAEAEIENLLGEQRHRNQPRVTGSWT